MRAFPVCCRQRFAILLALTLSSTLFGCAESRGKREARERRDRETREESARSAFLGHYPGAVKLPRDSDDDRLTVQIQDEAAATQGSLHWSEPDRFDVFRERGAIILSCKQENIWLKLQCSEDQLKRIRSIPSAGSWGTRFLFVFTVRGVSPIRFEVESEGSGEDASVTLNDVAGRLYAGKLEDLLSLD